MDSLIRYIKQKKYLLIPAILIGIAVLYVVDVWMVGTAVAYGFKAWFWGMSQNPFFDTSKFTMPNPLWYWEHPFATAWAWLTKGSAELSSPGVRTAWFGLNLIGLIAGILFFVLKYEKKLEATRLKPAGITHGSARWAKWEDLKKVADFGFGKGTILGTYDDIPIRIPTKPKIWMNKHILVVGAPGSGKSRAFVRPNIFEAVRSGESAVVTDPKGELFKSMAPWLKKNGYIVRAINLVNMQYSNKWNPLNELIEIIDADIISSVIIDSTETGPRQGGDAFWDRAERNLLKALVLYVCYDSNIKRREGKMAEVFDLVAAGDREAVHALFAKLPPSHPAKPSYNIYLNAIETVQGNIVTGLGTRLQVFQQEMVRKLTSKTEIDLTLPGREKCIYFVITPDTHGAFDFLASLFFTFLIVRLVKEADSRADGRLPVTVRLLLDEFANIVSIPEFEKKIATVRSRGIDCNVIIQGLPQLERKYGRAWQEIKSCCDTTVVIGVKDDYTARYISNMLGQSTVEVLTVSSDDRETKSSTARSLMTPSEIQNMKSRTCLVFLPDGTPPAKLQVIDYTEFPEAKELGEAVSIEEAFEILDPSEIQDEKKKEVSVDEEIAERNDIKPDELERSAQIEENNQGRW